MLRFHQKTLVLTTFDYCKLKTDHYSIYTVFRANATTNVNLPSQHFLYYTVKFFSTFKDCISCCVLVILKSSFNKVTEQDLTLKFLGILYPSCMLLFLNNILVVCHSNVVIPRDLLNWHHLNKRN